MITTVSSAAALNLALKSAHAGDTILLTAGSYAGVSASNLHFAQDVTVASVDPLAPAVITDINVNSSNGLAFSNLEFQANAAFGDNPFKVSSSQDVHFDHLNVHGSLDGNPQDDVVGFLIRESSNVSVTNSEFQQLHSAIAQLNNSYLTISGNAFHDIRTDGIRGGGSSNVTINDNTFRDFYPVAGDHGDAIQFWTTGTTVAAHDITVTDNMFIRGSGGAAQGIFISDEVGTLPYSHVTISNNYIIGGMYNGITVGGATNVTIDHNNVVGFSDMKSWIRLDDVNGATLTGNNADAFLISPTADKNIVQSGDVVIPLATDHGAAAYAQWLALEGKTTAADAGGVSLMGTAGDDTLTGTDFADTLNGGGGGTDVLTGGGGDDLYIISGKATIIEAVGGGNDTVESSASFTLPNNVENLILTGSNNTSGGGNSLDNQMTGNDAANRLSGAGGDDTINGGAGDDTITGGHGDDLLTGGPGADTFIFNQGDGHDTITDFGAGGEHDALDISSLLNAGFAPTLTETTAGVTVSFSTGDSILLAGLHVADLHATATGFIF